MQQAMAERNAAVPTEKRIEFRVGINVGDVIFDEGDLYGDGVNVAARLEGLAEPGGIQVSGTAYDQVKGKVPFVFEDLGAKPVKNIADPVRIYRVAIAPAQNGIVALPLPDRPSIAVLPFANLSGDPEQEYFADGMAEDIITALSRFHWFFVIARNSSFVFKGRNVDVRQIGRELGVRYVLEGSVRKAGDRLRITVQLIEAATGNHLWAEKYDGALADIFDLQDKITEGVVGAVEPSVRMAEIDRSRRKRPDSLDAYDLVLRAQPHYWAFSPGDNAKAAELVGKALLIDPGYPSAHGLAAGCYCQSNVWGALDDAGRKAAIRHANAVMSSNTDDAFALAAAGLTFTLLARDYDAARNAFDQAVAINPNGAQVLAFSSMMHSIVGDRDIAIDHAQKSIRLGPFDPLRVNALNSLCRVEFQSAHYEESMGYALRAIQAAPGLTSLHVFLAANYVRLGRMAEARQTAHRVLSLNPNFRCARWVSNNFLVPAHREAMSAALREAGLPE
jgi:TolB-like protein/Tfp pilus assembly protein PilF